MKLLVNIPAYNEAETIKKTIQDIPREIEGVSSVTVQVVDDGSTDDTALSAKEAGADIVYSHNINRGLGIAFRSAVLQALEQGVDTMVNIDADGQFNPKDIPQLIKPVLEKRADIVIGSRFSGIKPKGMPFIRKSLNKLAAQIVGSFLGTKTDDITCGFRAYSREAMLKLNLTHQFTYTQETIIDALSKKLKIIWIPVQVVYFKNRKAKLTKSLLNFIYQSLMIIFKTLRDTKPLKFFGFPALISIIASLTIFSVFIFNYLQTFKISPYRNWIGLGSIFLFLGIQFIIFAFLADMVKSNRQLIEDRMYEEKKLRFSKNKTTPE
ncbi:MAG: glycosyltransferase family 2 protein [Patescibacteria group bacterium]|nr:glycosyltransferase family 2 protein [Patescibacteria group bacterium]